MMVNGSERNKRQKVFYTSVLEASIRHTRFLCEGSKWAVSSVELEVQEVFQGPNKTHKSERKGQFLVFFPRFVFFLL